MSRLLLRRKPSIKANIKPASIVKEPKPKPAVEFRWSTSVVQTSSPESNLLVNFHLIDLENSQQKAFFSSPFSAGRSIKFVLFNSPTTILYLARNSAASPSVLSMEKLSPCSPRLPNINNTDKKKELPISPDENTNGNINPLSITYSQLHQAQHPSPTKKKSETRFSIYPLLNNKRNNLSGINNDILLSSKSTSSSTTNQRRLTNDKYIRLPISQLRRLHVSNKYIKEAKTLYFNATSKVFVPRHSIVQIS
jgi:hypothetical protein